MKPVERQTHSPQSLKNKALWYLAKREHSRAELALKLGRASPKYAAADAALIEEVLEWCEQQGWLSDARFAEAYVRAQESRVSRGLLASKLKLKGVDAETVAAALPVVDEESELSTAWALWQRRYGLPTVDDKDKARQMRFLLARGFSYAHVMRIMHRAGALAVDGYED